MHFLKQVHMVGESLCLSIHLRTHPCLHSPADATKTLGIKLPFLVMIIKNLKKYFSFEVQVLDDKNVRRRFRASNYQVSCS